MGGAPVLQQIQDALRGIPHNRVSGQAWRCLPAGAPKGVEKKEAQVHRVGVRHERLYTDIEGRGVADDAEVSRG